MTLPSATTSKDLASAWEGLGCAIRDRCCQCPDAIAVADAAGELSYRELWEASASFAQRLVATGVEPGSSVGVGLERNRHACVVLVGILLAGCHYVPLEDGWPAKRIGSVADILGLRHVVLTGRWRDRAEEVKRAVPQLDRLLLVDVPWQEPSTDGDASGICAASSDEAADTLPGVAAEATAYIIFTSGSTGVPKGVEVGHAAPLNLFRWLQNEHQLTPTDRVLCVSSFAFDLSVFDVFGTLCFGGTVRIASEEEKGDPAALLEILSRERITLWDSTPALLEQVLRFHRVNPVNLHNLRLVYLSGDWIPLSLPDELKRVAPHARLIAMGGATEATIWSNAFEVGEVNPSWKSIPYGHSIAGAVYHVLRPDGTRCNTGEPGELCIGGGVLAKGYAGDPERTAAAFVEDLLLLESDPPRRGRGYRTGDRARVHPEGWIELLGRLDRQVKINGFRVELGEVEVAVRRYPGVAACVCVAMRSQTSTGRSWLRACVCAASGKSLVVSNLRAHASGALPSYMVPAEWLFLERLPLTSNGKIDVQCCANFAAPAEDPTASEKLAESIGGAAGHRARILETLGLPVLSIAEEGSSSLRLLGVDSLGILGLRLQAEAEGIQLPPGDLLDATLSEILSAPRRKHPIGGQVRPSAASRAADSGQVPLAPSQRWLLDRQVVQPLHNGFAGWFQVAEEVSPAQMATRWLRLQQEESVLRLRFDLTGRDARQWLVDRSQATPLLDLGMLPGLSEGEAELRERGHQLISQRMEKQRGGGLLALGQQRQGDLLLFLFLPHLLADGLSVDVVLERLCGMTRGKANASEEFVGWCHAVEARRSEAADPMWEKEFLQLPWEAAGRWTTPSAALLRYADACDRELQVPPRCWTACREASQAAGVSADLPLLAALVAGLAAVLRSEWLAVDVSGHGREDLCSSTGVLSGLGYFSSVHPALLAVADAQRGNLPKLHQDLYRKPWRGHAYEEWRQTTRGRQQTPLQRPPEIKYNVHPGALAAPPPEHSRPVGLRPLSPLPVAPPLMMKPEDPRTYLLNIDLMPAEAGAGPRLRLRYDHRLLPTSWVDDLLTSLPRAVDSALARPSFGAR